MKLFFMILIMLITSITLVALDMNIRREREVGELDIVNRTIPCFIALGINLLFGKYIEAIINPFTKRVHIVYKDTFHTMTTQSILYKHEYVHILQIKKLGWFKYIILYAISRLRGYANSVYEKQAIRWQYKKEIDVGAIYQEIDNKLMAYK